MKNESGNGLLEVVCILDRSGSMSGKEDDTIGGFNSILEKHKELDNVIWSTVLFNDEFEVVHDRVPIGKVKPLTEEEYYVRGCTALLDAVGRSIDHIAKCHKYAKADDRPTNALFIINTDGRENSSEEYSFNQVKKMIEEKQECLGWEFIYLGEGIDAVVEASRIGIRRSRAAGYRGTSERRKECYDIISDSVYRMAYEDYLEEDCLEPFISMDDEL